MANSPDIVAIALLDRDDVSRIGSSLRLVFKADNDERFKDLLDALDRVGSDSPALDSLYRKGSDH